MASAIRLSAVSEQEFEFDDRAVFATFEAGISFHEGQGRRRSPEGAYVDPPEVTVAAVRVVSAEEYDADGEPCERTISDQRLIELARKQIEQEACDRYVNV